MDGIECLYRKNPYLHDYDNLNFDTPDYDEGLGLAGRRGFLSRGRLQPAESSSGLKSALQRGCATIRP
jgi:hypothetical protein